jgi:hypothetical protein
LVVLLFVAIVLMLLISSAGLLMGFPMAVLDCFANQVFFWLPPPSFFTAIIAFSVETVFFSFKATIIMDLCFLFFSVAIL